MQEEKPINNDEKKTRRRGRKKPTPAAEPPVQQQTQTAPEPPPKVVERPAPKIMSSIPQPKRLSNQASELTNDILWKEGLVLDGEVGLVNARPIQEFSPDAASFETLLEEEYKAISDVDKAFVKAIPQSVYNHFHHTLYWYRLSVQAVANGTSSCEQECLINVVNSHDISVPSGAAAYLAGLGDFEDVTGVKHRLASVEPLDHGHFGRATAQTHQLYETLPAPAISLQRVLEDLQYTVERDRDPVWDIAAITPQGNIADAHAPHVAEAPDEDVPADEQEDPDLAAAPQAAPEPVALRPRNRPTVNMLGWRPARLLDKNQLSEVRNLFKEVPVDVAHVRCTIPRYAYCPELFELALRRIREIMNYKLVPLPTNRGGSIAQQLIWDPEAEHLDYLTRQSASQGAITSHTKIHARIATIGKVLCYRSIRRNVTIDDNEYAPWACYGFNNYLDVPENWRANRNTRVVAGLQTLCTARPFSGTICYRRDALVEFLSLHSASYWNTTPSTTVNGASSGTSN